MSNLRILNKPKYWRQSVRIELGKPYSYLREERVNYLWKLNLSELHSHVDREIRDGWKEWLSREIKMCLCWQVACVHHQVKKCALRLLIKKTRSNIYCFQKIAKVKHPNYATLNNRPSNASSGENTWMKLIRTGNVTLWPNNLRYHFSAETQSKHRKLGYDKAQSTNCKALCFIPPQSGKTRKVKHEIFALSEFLKD